MVGVFIGLAICSMLLFKAVSSPLAHPPLATVNTPVSSKTAKAIHGLPIRLIIPAISVNAYLDYVSLTTDGELGVPTAPANAAWYDQGPRPGEKGSAVIDGHYGWVNNTPAVFDNLNKLHQGDNLYVKDDHGVTTSFVVTAVQTISQDQNAKPIFISSDSKAHLNLITCQGTWNQNQKSYSDRLVVFADKVI